ncbi:putative receptor protein kinase TMK1-like [Hibiscus syriacus]|uniref:Receptor protein kinase TMK1-like n=1 Tax=Hibiscus syriacus TaxID=106335 RepID=A0A6A3BNK8_HIBSY|nr:brassinosteroid-related acyltransferase 1-like [Hibiscus syriacus]KAE8716672.1 putative receptor protein kinase TMK1-like [Hibiscus syriacus]
MEIKQSVQEKIVLKPLKPFKRQTIQLSGFDRISPAILYSVLFYEVGDQSFIKEEDDPFGRAKEALAKVLVPWYPVAGRFRINEGSGKLEIDCNNQGVLLVTAVTDSKLEELGRLHEYKACYENLVPKLPFTTDIAENPIAVAQITRFACGGLALGFGGSHALFDGIGAFNFLSSWAHISNGKPESELIVPNHSRDALLSSIYSHHLSPAHASIYEQNHITAIQDLYGIPMEAKASDDRFWGTALAKFSQADPQAGLELVTLAIGKETVEILKAQAIERGNLLKCSTFDVLCAHLWKARVKTLNLDANTNICLQFPVDSRSRLRPPLGNNFTGNAFVLASVSCSVKNLLEQPLHDTIRRIQSAKDEISDEYIKLYAMALEASDKFFPSMLQLTIVSDWSRFPFHDLDFGWGKVSNAAILTTPVPETAFLMVNLEESGGGYLVRIGIGRQYVHDLVTNFNNLS